MYVRGAENSGKMVAMFPDSRIELGAAHFQLISFQLDHIPAVFIVKRFIPVYSGKVGKAMLRWLGS